MIHYQTILASASLTDAGWQATLKTAVGIAETQAFFRLNLKKENNQQA